MRLIKKILSLFLGLALVCAMGAGAYFAIRFLVGLLGAAEVDFSSPAAVVSFVALAVAFIIADSIRGAGKRNEANHLREQQAATYQLSAGLWDDLLQDGADSDDQRQTKLSGELRALESLLVLYASPGVIRAHAALRAACPTRGARRPDARALFAKALIEMRRDLGTDMRGLAPEELSKLILGGHEQTRAQADGNAYQDLRPRVSLAPNS